MAQLKADFPEDVRVVYRHFPLPSHDKALLSAQAADAAGLQGDFWGMHDLLFTRQSEWSGLSVAAFQDWLVAAASELDLDAGRFAADLQSDSIVSKVQLAQQQALNLGLPGTPTLVINGQYYDGPWDPVNLSAIIKLIKLEGQQYTDCPPLIIDPLKQYRATLQTSKGEIVIELLAEQAPIAVNNFVFLAREGWYDGVTFHRVLPGFVAQAGDPTGTGFGGPGYAFANEVVPELTFDGPGVLAMANAGPDSNGSQFFITFAAQPQLNGGYTIFGRVLSGMDVAQNLAARDPSRQPDAPPGDRILQILIEER